MKKARTFCEFPLQTVEEKEGNIFNEMIKLREKEWKMQMFQCTPTVLLIQACHVSAENLYRYFQSNKSFLEHLSSAKNKKKKNL